MRNLMNPKQSIQISLRKQIKIVDYEYAIKLKTSFIAARILLKGSQAFRGRNEKEISSCQGHFLEIVKELRIAYGIKKFRGMTCGNVQKDLCCASAYLVTSNIVSDVGNDFFVVLIYKSGDVSAKEQMVVCLRYVDSEGCVVERFLGIVHVKDTIALSLKQTLLDLLTPYKLSVSKIRGQGYDGASNMSGRFGGLRTLIQNENSSDFYVHWFAHLLQLELVAAVSYHVDVSAFFSLVISVVNIIGCSNKRQELLRDAQFKHLAELVEQGLVKTGRGLNQLTSLSRACDTRWGSHYKTLISISNLFGPLICVLQKIREDVCCKVRGEAQNLLKDFLTFDFIFMLSLMVDVLGVTHNLNLALQRCDQDFLNALNLVKIGKVRLQKIRDDGWDILITKVVEICMDHVIEVPDMNDQYYYLKSRHQGSSISNLHHYKNDCFFNILNVQLKELNDRFDVGNTELLHCVACLIPISKFEAFDVEKLMSMTKLHPTDFLDECESNLHNELANYIEDVRDGPRFFGLKGIVELSKQLVATGKSRIYISLYKLVKFALIFPVATASVERIFQL